jgi:multidrug efflux system membrane fusion protein
MDTPTPAVPHHRSRWLINTVIVLVVLLAAFFAWRKFRAPPPPPPVAQGVPVTTARVASSTVPIARNGVGTVIPVASVTVRTRVDGQLIGVDFKEGQDVKEGQVLVRIDPRTFQAALDQISAQKAKDEATLANARADLTRYGELIKEDATTQQTLDTQRALVNQLAATVKSDDAQIHAAQVQLSFTTIAAPISGRVGARLVDPGNIVHATDTTGLLVINQIDPIAVQFTLPESSFQAVNKALNSSHEPLAVEAIDRDTHEVLAPGKLVLLNNQIDVATGTISMKAQFANAQHRLWPGQSVDARVVLGERADALTVPAAAVQRNQDGFFVYVIGTDDKARAQVVTVADTVKGQSVIESGLTVGERVVIDGQYRLTPGSRVTEKAPVVTAEPVATSAGAKP